MKDRLSRAGAGLLVTSLCALVAGCGWTPRDQLAYDRALTFTPTSGDGSVYAEAPELSQTGYEVSRAGSAISDSIR